MKFLHKHMKVYKVITNEDLHVVQLKSVRRFECASALINSSSERQIVNNTFGFSAGLNSAVVDLTGPFLHQKLSALFMQRLMLEKPLCEKNFPSTKIVECWHFNAFNCERFG